MTTDPSCAHCGLPVPAALRAANDGDPSFCCRACETVFDAIHANGLGRFYAMRDDARPESPPDVGRDYDVFDDDAFIPAHTRDAGSGRRVVEFHLQGVHCAACVWLVERLPHLVDGVIEARLDIGRHLATITWDPDRVALSTIARGLDSLGYVPHPRRAATLRDARRREDRRHLIRIGIAGACAANTMVIAFALYGARISGMDPTLALVFRVASLGLTLIAMLGPGRVFLTGARSSLRTGRLHMDVPVTIALLAGIAWGATNTIRGAGEVYFESLTTVIFLLLVGRWIQHRQQRRAADALELLFTLTPSTARRVQPDGSIREVPSASLRPGDRVEIRAGDTIPADGVVFDGRSTVDLSLLTGEARPIEVEVGALLHASTVNLGAPLVMDVTVTGDDTRVGRLMALVQSFSSTRPPIVRLADRVAHWFVIVALALAAMTVVLWLFIDPSLAVEHAIALLIVTCPCALGLATPLALMAAIGRAANRGILIKGGDVIEHLARPGIMHLDKTGTVTAGRLSLRRWTGDETVRPLVDALERQVNHPVARALVGPATDTTLRVDDVVHVGGGGIEGRVDGRRVLVGSPTFVTDALDDRAPWADAAVRAATASALTPVVVAVDGTIRAVAALGDAMLDDAPDAVAALRRRGWDVDLLSGDDPTVVATIAAQAGIDRSFGGQRPEDKARRVREDAATRTTVMVGDGVNDAAALAAAHVGIAVHGGAEASLEAADVSINRPGLQPLLELVDGARRTVRVIRRNLAISLFYNVVTASLAIAGQINPIIAAILMPLSSLSVVTLSFRSRTFGD